MSLPAPYIESYHVADGVTTSFSFGTGFTALSAENVKCIIYFDDGTHCVPTFTVNITTGYITIVTLTKPDGTVLTVPPEGSIVRVFRDTPEQQNVTASQLQNYTAKQLERIFDSIVAMIQETAFLAKRKTVRLTETQRDVSIEKLTEEKDQCLVYWDFGTHQLKVTEFRQDHVATIELVARVEAKADEALRIANVALENSSEALETSRQVKQIAENALDVAQQADEKSDLALQKAQHAEDYVFSLHSERFVFTISENQTTLTFSENIENKEIDLYWNGQYITKTGNWSVSGNTIVMSFGPEAGDKIAVVLNVIRQAVNLADLDEHNADEYAHPNLIFDCGTMS